MKKMISKLPLISSILIFVISSLFFILYEVYVERNSTGNIDIVYYALISFYFGYMLILPLSFIRANLNNEIISDTIEIICSLIMLIYFVYYIFNVFTQFSIAFIIGLLLLISVFLISDSAKNKFISWFSICGCIYCYGYVLTFLFNNIEHVSLLLMLITVIYTLFFASCIVLLLYLVRKFHSKIIVPEEITYNEITDITDN